MAQYRARDWKSAIESLQESIELTTGSGSYFFHLAMAHWQLGNPEQAREWYDKGESWLIESKNDEEVKVLCFLVCTPTERNLFQKDILNYLEASWNGVPSFLPEYGVPDVHVHYNQRCSIR